MRVCFVTSSLHPSDGWGRYARELVAAAAGVGIEPVIITCRNGAGDAAITTERHDLLPPLLAGRCELARSLLHAPAVRRIASSCDVMHGLVEPWLPLVALATPKAMPLVQTAHGSWAVHPLRRRLVGRVFARALARTDLLICQSRVTRDAVLAAATPRRHEVLLGGVDSKIFAGGVGDPPPGWPADGRVMLSVGAFKPRKGHHVALEAFALLAAAHADLRWVVVGGGRLDGDYATGLQRRAEVLGLGHRIHWLSNLSDAQLAACYQRSVVFVLLPISRHGSFEGLGLVYLEAAAAGLPAVGTLASGAMDAIADGESGLLVPPDDGAAAAAAIGRLLDDANLAIHLGNAGRIRAETLSWTRLATELAVRYRELVAERRPKPVRMR
jgi:phosphatidylinositol alpha-1,6-mannosyltransferase